MNGYSRLKYDSYEDVAKVIAEAKSLEDLKPVLQLLAYFELGIESEAAGIPVRDEDGNLPVK